MISLWQRTAIVSTTTLMLLISSLPAIATIWSGRGRIVRGSGQGGSVSLELEEHQDNSIEFRSGPSRGKIIPSNRLNRRLNGSVKLGNETWQFEMRSNRELEVILYQNRPNRIVEYFLRRRS